MKVIQYFVVVVILALLAGGVYFLYLGQPAACDLCGRPLHQETLYRVHLRVAVADLIQQFPFAHSISPKSCGPALFPGAILRPSIIPSLQRDKLRRTGQAGDFT